MRSSRVRDFAAFRPEKEEFALKSTPICTNLFHSIRSVGNRVSCLQLFWYLGTGDLILDCSAIDMESMIWDFVSGVESGSLFSSAFVFSMKLS